MLHLLPNFKLWSFLIDSDFSLDLTGFDAIIDVFQKKWINVEPTASSIDAKPVGLVCFAGDAKTTLVKDSSNSQIIMFWFVLSFDLR